MTRSYFRVALAGAGMLAALATPSTGLAGEDDVGGSWWPRWSLGQMMEQWGLNGTAVGWHRHMMGWGGDAELDRIDGRLAFVKAELKLTDQQNPAWETFATAVKAVAEDRNNHVGGMWHPLQAGDFGNKPLPEQMGLMETTMQARLDQLSRLKEAVGTFYASLDEKQKVTADDIVLPALGMRFGGGGARMMMYED